MKLNFQTTDYNKNIKRAKVNLLVGKIDNQYYFCDDIFTNKDGSKGATATVLEPITQDEVNARWDLENQRELGEEAVKANMTDEGLEDWVNYVKSVDGEESVLDSSGSEYYPQLRDLGISEEEYPFFDCTGGGRSFSKDMVWDELYNPEVWELIKQYED